MTTSPEKSLSKALTLRQVYGFLLFIVVFSQSSFAEIYIRDYTYEASEADSKITSRTNALDQLKTILLQEIGTHVRQEITITKDGSGGTYASEDVEAITAGLTKVEIIEEKWNGETYYLKAKIEADTARVLNALEEFKNEKTKNNEQLELLTDNRRKLEKAREAIAQLKRQLTQAKSKAEKEKVVVKYNKQVEQISLSDMYDSGYYYEEQSDFENAFSRYRIAAEKGYSNAQHNLGVMYNKGTGVKQDYVQAVYWYRKAAVQGVAESQYNLGHLYFVGDGVKQDYAEAVNWYRKAAVQGYAAAQYNLGTMYSKGTGVKQNYVQAVNWYRKAAEQGDADAQYNLGIKYDVGTGVKQDYAQAFNWYLKAAEQGIAKSQYNLGHLYFVGDGVKQDYAEAVNWYRKAAVQGYSKAQYNLGVMYDTGSGVKQDYARAVNWYYKSSRQGHVDALYNLGFMYADGQGVMQDYHKAFGFFQKACMLGKRSACDNYQALKKKGY